VSERPAELPNDVDQAIERVVISRIAMPLEEPIRSGIHSIDGIYSTVVEIGAGGVTGVGYAFAFSINELRAVAALAEDLADVVRGAPGGVRERWRAMWDRLNFIGRAGPGAMAMAAIDTALWDLLARQAGVPLYRLLGGAEPAIELYGAGGWLSWPVERVVEEARSFATAGYRAYKMRLGNPDWRADVRRVQAVREAIPPELGLMVDVNQAWSADVALAAGRELEDLGLLWIEEPIDAHDYRGQAELARALGTPIAAGETLWGRRDFEHLLDAGGVDVVQLDLMRCGGVTPFLSIAALVEATGAPVTSHLFTPISAHLLAAVPGASMAEHLPSWFDPLFEQQPVINDGVLGASAEPGLGLTLSPGAVARWGVPA
jgi:L-alanine-DL-glutamate epimerase-like enolase superfamily enzyme